MALHLHTPTTTHTHAHPFPQHQVAVIDTEGAFRPEHVRCVAARYGLDGDAVLDNILSSRAHTFEQMDDLLVGLAARMAEEP